MRSNREFKSKIQYVTYEDITQIKNQNLSIRYATFNSKPTLRSQENMSNKNDRALKFVDTTSKHLL